MEKKHLNKILSIKLFRILGDVNIGVVYRPIKHLKVQGATCEGIYFLIFSQDSSLLYLYLVVQCNFMLGVTWNEFR